MGTNSPLKNPLMDVFIESFFSTISKSVLGSQLILEEMTILNREQFLNGIAVAFPDSEDLIHRRLRSLSNTFLLAEIHSIKPIHASPIRRGVAGPQKGPNQSCNESRKQKFYIQEFESMTK